MFSCSSGSGDIQRRPGDQWPYSHGYNTLKLKELAVQSIDIPTNKSVTQ